MVYKLVFLMLYLLVDAFFVVYVQALFSPNTISRFLLYGTALFDLGNLVFEKEKLIFTNNLWQTYKMKNVLHKTFTSNSWVFHKCQKYCKICVKDIQNDWLVCQEYKKVRLTRACELGTWNMAFTEVDLLQCCWVDVLCMYINTTIHHDSPFFSNFGLAF